MNEHDNCILVGDKPFMNYVTGVVMQFTLQNSSEVSIKARGKYISRAVDVAQISVNQFLEGVIKIKNISTDSHLFKTPQGRNIHVSTINILLSKQ